MTNLAFDGKVEHGKLTLYDPDGFKRTYESLEGKPIQLIIQRAKSLRSNQQNRYLWGVVYKTLSDETGNDVDDLHEYLKQKFNPKFVQVVSKITGETDEMTTGGSTAKMSTVDFMEYAEKIQRWAVEFLGVNIPDPNQTDFLNEENQNE